MRRLLIIMATISIAIGFTPESERVIARWADGPIRVARGIEHGMQRFLVHLENAVKLDAFGSGPGPGGGQMPVGMRSRELRRAVTHKQESATAGYVGTAQGVTSAYARVILGPGTTVIRPKNAEHLWLPAKDNLNPSGVMKLSPRAAWDILGPKGKPRLRVFKSKRGGLVAFLPDEKGGVYARGEKKGLPRGRLLFSLHKQVTVHGTDALAKVATAELPQGQQIFAEEIAKAFNSSGGGA